MRHAHAGLPAGALFEICDDAGDRPYAFFIRTLRRGHAQALANRAIAAQHDAFDLGSAKVDTDPHARKRARTSIVLFTPTSSKDEASHLVAAARPSWKRCSRKAGSIRNLLTDPIGAIEASSLIEWIMIVFRRVPNSPMIAPFSIMSCTKAMARISAISAPPKVISFSRSAISALDFGTPGRNDGSSSTITTSQLSLS